MPRDREMEFMHKKLRKALLTCKSHWQAILTYQDSIETLIERAEKAEEWLAIRNDMLLGAEDEIALRDVALDALRAEVADYRKVNNELSLKLTNTTEQLNALQDFSDEINRHSAHVEKTLRNELAKWQKGEITTPKIRRELDELRETVYAERKDKDQVLQHMRELEFQVQAEVHYAEERMANANQYARDKQQECNYLRSQAQELRASLREAEEIIANLQFQSIVWQKVWKRMARETLRERIARKLSGLRELFS